MIMVLTSQSGNLHILKEVMVYFGDILTETRENSACSDMGGNSHVTRLSSDSLYLP